MTSTLPSGWRNDPVAAGHLLEVLRRKKAADTPPPSFDTPGHLAAAINPATVQTPALNLIDATLARVDAGEVERVIINMPPQEGKSERTTHYGALWFLRQNPHLRVAIVSFSDRIARRFSTQIRTDIQTFNGTLGSIDLGLRLKASAKAAFYWELASPNTGSLFTTSIGGTFVGTPVDLLIIDDPVKDYQAAESQIQSETVWEWWTSVARQRLAPGAPVILIQTRWHENDLAGRLLAKQAEDEKAGLEYFDRWEVVNIPAQAERADDPLGRQPGEFMVSARGRSREQWLATKAATPSRTWQAMYQGNPSPDAGDVWKRQYWGIYDRPLWTVINKGASNECFMVDEFDEMAMSWDMTFKDSDDADYVVGQVWMRRGPNSYLLDQTRARMSFTESVHAFENLAARWPQADLKLVEEKANGSAIIDTLRKKMPGIVAVNPKESKYARASSVAPFIEAHGVHLPRTAIALFPVADFIEEAAQFPNGAHDDQVDGASQILQRWYVGAARAADWLAEMARARAEKEAAELAATTIEPSGDPLTDARNAAWRAANRR